MAARLSAKCLTRWNAYCFQGGEYPHLIASTLAACRLQCFNRHTLLQYRALAVKGQIMATFMQGPQR